MDFIRRWWWPSYVFTSPFLFYPPSLNTVDREVFGLNFGVIVGFTVLALFGGFLLEWAAHPTLRLTDIRFLPKSLRAHPALALALLYGVWTLISAILSPNQVVALTGSLEGGTEGAFLSCAMVGVFTLVYLQAKRDSELFTRLLTALVISSGLLASLAFIEVLIRKPFLYNVTVANLPMVTFPQRGHLAGFFVLAIGATLGLLFSGSRLAFGVTLLLSLGIGLTQNRAALLGVGLTWLTMFGQPKKLLWAGLAMGLGLAVGWTAIHSLNTGGSKQLSEASTLQNRTNYYWPTAFRGIAKRPVTGWGGPAFEHYWLSVVSFQEAKNFLRDEFGTNLVEVFSEGGVRPPRFIVESAKGDKSLMAVTRWKAHNQFLDVALMYGLVGLALYLALLILGLRGMLSYSPASLGLFGYHIFLLFWFVPPHALGVLWAVWGIAAAKQGVLTSAGNATKVAPT